MNDWGIAIVGVVFSVFGSWLVAKWTANKAIKNEMDKGVVLLWSLLKRYFISCHNCYDIGGLVLKIKSDEITRAKHLRVIKFVEADLIELQHNYYYLNLISKNANIEMLLVQLSFEIAENERKNTGNKQNIANQESTNKNEFSLNSGSLKNFLDVYNKIKKDIPNEAMDNEITGIMEILNHISFNKYKIDSSI
jgi:hypothetical protein